MQQTVDLVRVLRAAFPRASFNEESEAVYTAALIDLDVVVLAEAIGEVIRFRRSEEGLPTPGDIRSVAYAKMRDSRPALEAPKDEGNVDWKAAFDSMTEEEKTVARRRLEAMGVKEPTL